MKIENVKKVRAFLKQSGIRRVIAFALCLCMIVTGVNISYATSGGENASGDATASTLLSSSLRTSASASSSEEEETTTTTTSTKAHSGQSVYVDGATFVDYSTSKIQTALVNLSSTISDLFYFCSGSNGKQNQCWYGQVYQGLASSTLTNGTFSISDNYYSVDLFPTSGTSKSYVDAYYDSVAVEFEDEGDGWYSFNSDTYSYALDTSDASDVTLDITGDSTENGKYFPFGEYDYHFGMKLPISFTLDEENATAGSETTTTDDDTIFTFSGDDDVFVYIDGELVMDLGGIHNTMTGTINFSTGVVTITGHNSGSNTSSGSVTTSGTKAIYNSSASNILGNDYNVYTDVLGYEDVEAGIQALASGTHTLTVVYFERGTGLSNCSINCNIGVKTSTDVEFTKEDSDTGEVLEGAGFTLYSNAACTNEAYSEIFSDENGIVRFDAVTVNGTATTYYMKETTAPDGYDSNDTLYKVIVRNDNGTYSYSITAVNNSGKELTDDTTLAKVDGAYVIYNDNSTTLTVDKTSSLIDEENRIFQIDLTVDGYTTEASEGSTTTTADVTLVIDTSGSMTFTDAAIVTASDAASAYASLDQLDTSKIYFTVSASEYGSGISVTSSVKSRLCTGAIDNSKAYGLPTSGYYLFYTNGAWYMKSVTGSRGYGGYGGQTQYNLSSQNALSTSGATKITSSNCPTTIYTNRSEVMMNAATSLVKQLAETSTANRVAIVTFQNEGESTTQCDLTELTESGLNTVLSAIQNSYGVCFTATFPSDGVENAVEIYNSDTNTENDNYTILFTDGDCDDTDTSELKTAAAELQKLSTIYVAAVSVSSDTASLYKQSVATSEDYFTGLTDVTKLAGVFSTIGKEVSYTNNSDGGNIVDYIDSRFVVTDAEGNAYSVGDVVDDLGGILCKDEDTGDYYVSWSDQNIDGWSTSIYVTAKENFLGGNVITTNTAASCVLFNGVTKYFPLPTVNVPVLSLSAEDIETTVFVGEEITSSEFLAVLKEKLSNENFVDDSVLSELISDENYDEATNTYTLTKDYSYGTSDKIGTLVYTLTLNDTASISDHEAQTAGATEKYTLRVTYTPDTVSVREDTLDANSVAYVAPTAKGGSEVSSVSASTTYKVYIVDGTLTITKKIKTSDYNSVQGDPIFTYKITRTYDGGKEVFYKTLRFTSESDTSGSYYVETVTLTDLPYGTYTVEEESSARFAVDNVTSVKSLTDATTAVEDDVFAVSFGSDFAEAANSDLDEDSLASQAGVAFVNEKESSNNYSHTDVSKNTITFDADGNVTVTEDKDADNGETWIYQVFSNVTTALTEIIDAMTGGN